MLFRSATPCARRSSSAGDPTEEKRLAHGVAGRREVADVVEAKVRRRVPEQDRARPVVEARGDAQLATLLPHRIVVVVAVEAITSYHSTRLAASGRSSASAG